MRSHSWIDQPDQLATVVERLARCELWGLDTEFHREHTYYPHLALIQVVWPEGVALIDPYCVDITPLKNALANATVIVHASDQDLELLDQCVGARPRRLFDTQIAAGFLGFETPSLSNLLRQLLDVRLPKSDRLTDWTQRPLTREQREYAAADVTHLPELHAILTKRLEALGRLDWALGECSNALNKSRKPKAPDKAWWRLKGTGSLSGQARQIAQTVAQWRELRAAELDLPVRMVLSDMAILAIAQRPPRNREELLAIRGIDGRHTRKDADKEILHAVSRGKQLLADQLRVPPRGEPEGPLRPAITAITGWIAQLAIDLDLAASLLATRADIENLVRQKQGCRLADGWRRSIIADPVGRLLSGKARLDVTAEGAVRMVAGP